MTKACFSSPSAPRDGAGPWRHDLALRRAHPVVQPAVVQLRRDQDRAGLVQRRVVGVEVRPQPVVGAERQVLGVARPLEAQLAALAVRHVGPEVLAADAVVVERLDDVAERDAVVVQPAAGLEPGGLEDHPGADAVGLGDLGAEPLEVDHRRQRLAAAGAFLALQPRQAPGVGRVAQRRDQRLARQAVRRQRRQRRLVAPVAHVDRVADDAADRGLGERGRRRGGAPAGRARAVRHRRARSRQGVSAGGDEVSRPRQPGFWSASWSPGNSGPSSLNARDDTRNPPKRKVNAWRVARGG